MTPKDLARIGVALGLAVIVGMGWAAPAAATDGVSGEPVVAKPEPPGSNYASLTHLVTVVCDDAMERFYNFFGASPVAVEPFQVVGEFSVAKRLTLLGATLADQMSAGINNEAMPQALPASATTEQRLRGLLQEVDGYLRIHMSGQNSRGEWRSYVVTVEMSEPIYRALHTYVVM
ncbi:MAG TPA: hypothetical protein VLL73_03885 [Desulfurivibrionaceae bacterium]|nr:hypothetical protein [Desulfurivibrionaceae bacterium]